MVSSLLHKKVGVCNLELEGSRPRKLFLRPFILELEGFNF